MEVGVLKIFITTAAMVGLAEVEHHLRNSREEGEDTLEEVLMGPLRTTEFSHQAVAVRLFPAKSGKRRQEPVTKGMVTSHFASSVITALESFIDFDGFRIET